MNYYQILPSLLKLKAMMSDLLKRVEGKKYPVLSQEYIGTIDPVKGLLPKKVVVKTGVNDALVEYGLSYFMYKRFNRELKRSLFNVGGNATPLIKLAIIKFILNFS